MFSVYAALTHARTALATISQTPRLDAEALLAHVLSCERSYLYAHPESAISEPQNEQYQTLIQRRASGEPLAYIIGIREFWSLSLRATPRVLIPRPETELLVELALAQIPEKETWQIADLGTGSGAIAIALAKERPEARVIATDISEAALTLAADNAARLGISNVRFLAGDWFAPLRGRFHLIVSNPPYVDADDPHLRDPALRFEPRRALVSGMSGLLDVAILAREANDFLHPGGWLMLEHGFEQGAAVRKLFEESGFSAVRTYRDLAGRERVTLGLRRRVPNSADTQI